MSDIYRAVATSNVGRALLKRVNLPLPVELDRYQSSQQSTITGNILFASAKQSRCAKALAEITKDCDATVYCRDDDSSLALLPNKLSDYNSDDIKYKSLVFDATGIDNSEGLSALYHFFHPVIKKIVTSGRIVVIGLPPEAATTPQQAIAMRALEGFTRAIAKEVKRGCTAQLIYVEEGAESQLLAPLHFVLSAKSAYVSAQVIYVTKGRPLPANFDWKKPLTNKVALVTGAARGIGEAIADTLHRDGARLICLDVPGSEAELQVVAERTQGKALLLDISAADSPTKIAELIAEEFGEIDIIVHNAGITRDKTLGNMSEDFWNMAININLSSIERINSTLLEKKLINKDGRIVCVSSLSGIAGNFGQTNYATSKAGVIGLVKSYAPLLAKNNITINAVAPGFIETKMTDAMPFTVREAARRMNSMSQGGQPQDVAETIAFFASPASAGVNGNVIRVCGQSLIGA